MKRIEGKYIWRGRQITTRNWGRGSWSARVDFGEIDQIPWEERGLTSENAALAAARKFIETLGTGQAAPELKGQT